VSKPRTTWADLEKSSGDKGGEYTKEALKDLIEARRHNDMVRKREFEYLRKIRQTGGHDESAAEASPSVLQTHVPLESEERAQTLKKIDAIEEEMSRHWWRKKPDAGAAVDTVQIAQRVLSQDPADTAPHFQKTEIMPVASSVAAVTALASDQRIHAAAKAFASGDDMGAELHLLLVVGQEGGEQDIEVWMTLLDLYRATGQSDVFESRALEFVNRFGRSAPSWQNWVQGQAGAHAQAPVWCSTLQPQVTDLMPLQMLVQPGSPLTLDWSRLAGIDASAARAVLGLCRLWADQDLQLELRSPSRLLARLASQTPTGVATTERVWWDTRLAVLRLMGRTSEFEAVAMDFCLTYELSPPPWEPPRCRCVVHEPDAFPAIDVPRAPVAKGYVLTGAIGGQDRPWAQHWVPPEPGPLPWEIDGHGLLRMDMAAARDFLDWCRLQHAVGYRIHLIEVNRLVAALLLSLDVGDGLRLVLRND
jgi:hypothetical protein